MTAAMHGHGQVGAAPGHACEAGGVAMAYAVGTTQAGSFRRHTWFVVVSPGDATCMQLLLAKTGEWFLSKHGALSAVKTLHMAELYNLCC
jgi:hypothetical protein